MKILGIESSCDETACAVVEDGRKVLSNIVATSLDCGVKDENLKSDPLVNAELCLK